MATPSRKYSREVRYIESSAVIKGPGDWYRYVLTRSWWSIATPTRFLMFVMLNPSTADGQVDDPTIRRCVAFARREGFTGIIICNLFAFRATDPKDLRYVKGHIIGPENDQYLRLSAAIAEKVVVGWGASVDSMGEFGLLRARKVVETLSTSKPVWCLGKTKSGEPRHPLFVKGDTALELYAPQKVF